MYVILVYDIGEKRVAKVLKKCRQYLNWIQNSVFEGEISKANFTKLKSELKRIINEDEDSIIVFILRTTVYMKREIIGREKLEISNIL